MQSSCRCPAPQQRPLLACSARRTSSWSRMSAKQTASTRGGAPSSAAPPAAAAAATPCTSRQHRSLRPSTAPLRSCHRSTSCVILPKPAASRPAVQLWQPSSWGSGRWRQRRWRTGSRSTAGRSRRHGRRHPLAPFNHLLPCQRCTFLGRGVALAACIPLLIFKCLHRTHLGRDAEAAGRVGVAVGEVGCQQIPRRLRVDLTALAKGAGMEDTM